MNISPHSSVAAVRAVALGSSDTQSGSPHAKPRRAPTAVDGRAWKRFLGRSLTKHQPLRSFKPHEVAALQSDPSLQNGALLWAVHDLVSDSVVASYKEARKIMFGELDNDDGAVTCVYTGKEVETETIPNVETTGMNTEHTWPRSQGVNGTPAARDLHHLFPTDSHANSQRGSLPFGEVRLVKWENGGARLGLDEWGDMVFEPPKEHRGNVARSLFYVSAAYQLDIDDKQEEVLRRWHVDDKVDDAERDRDDAIAALQGVHNPFVVDPAMVDRVEDFTDWI